MSITPSVAVESVKKPSMPIFNGKTLYVGGSGEGNYSKILYALNDASDGDTVFVYDDSSPYLEYIRISKSIFLIGENNDTTVIDANFRDTVVTIQSDNVIVCGFTIKNCERAFSNWENNVIKIMNSKNVVIKNNIITIGYQEKNDYVAGVFLYNSSNNLIENNIIFEDNYIRDSVGVMLHANSIFNNVSNNEIYGYRIGISSWEIQNNTFYMNYIHHNDVGIECYGNGQIIKKNIISFNKHRGIEINEGENTIISGNIIMNNGQGAEDDIGFEIFFCVNNYVSDNHISNNNPNGLNVLYSYKIFITRNNFVDNVNNAFFSNGWWRRKFNVNRWYRNYWSDSKTGGFLPKIIPGEIEVLGIIFYHTIPWFDIDLRPANKPYDIGV